MKLGPHTAAICPRTGLSMGFLALASRILNRIACYRKLPLGTVRPAIVAYPRRSRKRDSHGDQNPSLNLGQRFGSLGAALLGAM